VQVFRDVPARKQQHQAILAFVNERERCLRKFSPGAAHPWFLTIFGNVVLMEMWREYPSKGTPSHQPMEGRLQPQQTAFIIGQSHAHRTRHENGFA
jgi:hypothetical protein